MSAIRVKIHSGEKDGSRYLWVHDHVDTINAIINPSGTVMMIGLETYRV